MRNAQEHALALLAGQRGLLGPHELTEAQEAARAHSVTLAEVLVAGQRISPQGAAALMEELAGREWVCQSCGATLAWTGLALLAALRCPGCAGAIAPRARPPGNLASSLASEMGPVELGDARRATIGPYVLVRELGRGSNGVVWLAEKPGLSRQFALKVLHESELGDEESVARFKLEAAIASKLDETGVIGVYDIGKDGRSWYYAMEYCPGETLEARIGRGPIGPSEAAEIMAALARTMEQAHQQGVIHRDLKPANVILDARTGKPRITDFGLAKDPTLLRDMTRSGDVLGTPYYMAPEQLAAEAGIDHRIDVYALGVLLYESLCGQRPYKAQNFAELVARVKKHPPPPLRDRAPSVPEPLAAICAQAMARRKSERYPRAADLADDLERWLRGDVPRAISNPSTRADVPRRPRLVVILPLLLLAALLGGAAGAGLVIARREPEVEPEATPGAPEPAVEAPPAPREGDGARDHLERAAALDREGIPAPRVLAELALAFDRAEGDEALRAEIRARRGTFGLRRSRPELALEEGRALREARAATPEQRLEGQWLTAQALLRLGRDDEALNELDALARRDPDGPRGSTAAAMRHRMVEDPARFALDRIDRALARDPRFVPALVERSAVLLELGRPLRDVEEALQAAAQVDPDDPRVLLGTATVRMLSGSPPDAVLAPIDRALRLSDPEADPEALRLRARVRLLLLGQSQAALDDLTRLLEERPRDPIGRLLRGVHAWLGRQPGKASEDWTTAWIAEPRLVWSELALLPPELATEVRERLGLLDGEAAIHPPRMEVGPALRARLEARAAAAGPAAGPILDALVGAAEGRPWRELVAAFVRADEADPLSSVVALERATVLAGRELFDPALGALRRARELGADGATCDRLEGDVWHRRGKRYKAVEYWDKAARRDDSVEALCAAAKSTYLRAGRREDPAFEDLMRRALAKDPDHAPTLMLSAWLVDPRVEGGGRLVELQRRVLELQGLIDAGVLELDYLRLVIDALRESGQTGNTLQLRFDDARLSQMIGLQERWGTLCRGAGPVIRAGESALMGTQGAPEAIRRRLMRRAVRLMREAREREPDRGEVWMWLGFLELIRGGEREDVLANWRRALHVEPLIQVRQDWIAAYGERFKETASLEALKLPVDPDAPPPDPPGEEPR